MRLNHFTTAILAVATLAVASGVSWVIGRRSAQPIPATVPPPSESGTRGNAPPGVVRYAAPEDWYQQGPLGTVVLPLDVKPEFIGPQACAECHEDRHKSFAETNHFRTSTTANKRTIQGPFEPGRNRLATQNRDLQYEMQKRPDGFYQVALIKGEEVHSERIDLIMGSGKIAQTYLYWRGDALYELPVSYFTQMESWVDSPGYPNGIALFSRPVQMRCLECHTTHFVGKIENPVNYRYLKEHYVLGITCERCHGPGREHVAFHQKNPGLKAGAHIVNPKKLPRDRMNDICAQCHSTGNTPTQPPFTFRPGRDLADYFEIGTAPSAGKPGVHTNNQLQRLRMSRCYQNSPRMSCATCHDPHQRESGKQEVFANRCQQCHEIADCDIADMGASIDQSCAECHMARHPVLNAIMRGNDRSAPIMMWDHNIQAKTPQSLQARRDLQSSSGN